MDEFGYIHALTLRDTEKYCSTLANRRRETPNEEFALIGLILSSVTLKLLIMIIRLDNLLRENPVTLND